MKKGSIKNRAWQSIRKVIAGAAAVSMLVTSAGVFAATDPYEEYKAWLLDFESGATGTPGGKVDNSARVIKTDDPEHGYVLRTESRDEGTASLANVFAKDDYTGLEAKDYVFSFEFCPKQTNVGYIMQAQSLKTDGATINYVCFVIDNDGTVGFAKNGGWVTPDHGDGSFHTRASYTVDTWHTADVVVDVDGKKISYYIDGKHLGDDTSSGNFGTGVFRSAGILTGKDYVIGSVDTTAQAVYFDNFRVTYTDENSFYSVTEAKENAVKLTLSETPAKDLTGIELFACDTGEKVRVSDVRHSGKTVTFTADALDGSRQYAIALPKRLQSVAGNKTDSDYVYFYPVAQNSPYVALVKLTDVYGEEYGPLEEIPITQSKITLEADGALSVDASSVLTAVSLKDASGNACTLSNPQISGNEITLDIDSFLNMSSDYTLSVNNLSGMNYTAKFKTNSEVIEGFFPVGLVLANGTAVADIESAKGAEVYASTEFINTTSDEAKAMVTVAAYKNTNGILEMLAADTAEIVIPSMKLVTAGPNENEEKIKLSVPSDADVVKTFLWKSAEDKRPLEAMISLPETDPAVPTGNEGIFQNGDGSLSLIAKTKSVNSDASLAVTADGEAYGDNAIYADQLTTDNDGTAAICFNMNCTSGDYTAVLTTADGTKTEFDFAYVNPAEFAGEASKLDSASSAEECEAVLVGSYAKFGISKSLFESVKLEQAAELLYNKLEDDGITLADTAWKDGVDITKQMFLIASAANGKLDNLFDYAEELKLDEDKNWEWYSKEYVKESVQKSITARQKGDYTTEKEFYERLLESYVLSVVQSPDGEGNLREVVQNFAAEIGINSTGKDSTYRALVGQNFNTYEELRDKYNALEGSGSSQSGSTGRPSGGSSSGGGGGGGGSFSKEYSNELKQQPSTEPITDDIFDDIGDFGWARQSIVYLAEKRIVTGKTQTEFCPADLVTREEFAAMLIRAFAENAEASDITFTDAEAGEWYIEYLAKAVNIGIVKGYDDGRFGIGDTITRQDMTVMLSRAAEYAGIVLELEAGDTSFADDGEIADYAREAVYALKQAGIVNGVTLDTFAPAESANRAQAAKVIFGLLNI